ncbi:MAG: DNA-binding response regulator [Chloroflexi bacterium RBG_16_54_18]|nr:MAG: DNA-binding response regulator [Chloroflexi bacterium RBG_16_54_18]
MNSNMILIVEDEPNIAEVVSLYLRRAGFQVKLADDGLSAMASLEEELPDLVILDLMLPGVDGLALARWLRGRSDVPIIMLTARRHEADRIAGFELGADDYVVKPFSPQELVSRVKAVLRRSRPIERENETVLNFDYLRIDPQKHLVFIRDSEVILTVREFDMLWLLAKHPRQVFSRQQLLEKVWGISEYIDPGTVTVHIRRLREKIEPDPSKPKHILTVWGVGYKFEP